MQCESKAKKETKETVAKDIVKRLHVENEMARRIYKAGFFDFARYLQAGGVFAEIKEMMTTNKLPQAMKPAKRQPRKNKQKTLPVDSRKAELP